jgi:cation/acetate symporter
MFLAGAFFACTTIFGLAAAHFVGQDAIRAADRGGNLTLPLLAQYLGGGKRSAGGEIMLAFIAAVAVATIIAVVAGLTLATSGAIAHDLYVNLIRKGNVHERAQVMAARITAITVGIVATLLGILAEGVNVAVLVILAICIAASANFPVLALSLFWRRFNTGGVIGGMGLGLQIPYHLNRAMDNGLTQDQAAEVITHLAFAPAPSTTSSVGLECDGC